MPRLPSSAGFIGLRPGRAAAARILAGAAEPPRPGEVFPTALRRQSQICTRCSDLLSANSLLYDLFQSHAATGERKLQAALLTRPERTAMHRAEPMNWTFVSDVGPWQTYHLGDEAMLEANIDLFRSIDPAANLIVVSADPAFTAAEYNVEAVPRLGFDRCGSDEEAQSLLRGLDPAGLQVASTPPAFLRLTSASDGLVISGGGNLNSTWPQFIYERLAFCRRAAANNLPIIVLGQTVGPTLAGPHREMVAEILQSAWWVGVRDAASYEICLRLGVPIERLSYQIDDAAFIEGAVPETALPFPLSDPWIGVTVHPLADPASDAEIFDQLAEQLAAIASATAAHLLFISHAAASLEVGAPWSDQQIGYALAARMHSVPLHVLPLMRSRQTAALTRRAAMIISTRYHPLVFGVAAGIPAIGLWTDRYTMVKLIGVAAHYQREQDVLPIADVATGRLARLAGSLWRNSDQRAASGQAESRRASEHLRVQQLERLVTGRAPVVPPQPDGLLRDLAVSLRQFEIHQVPDDLRPPAYDETVAYALSLKAETERLSNLLAQAAVEYQQVSQSRSEAIDYAVDLEANLKALSANLKEAASYAASVEQARDDLSASLVGAAAYAESLKRSRDDLEKQAMSAIARLRENGS